MYRLGAVRWMIFATAVQTHATIAVFCVRARTANILSALLADCIQWHLTNFICIAVLCNVVLSYVYGIGVILKFKEYFC